MTQRTVLVPSELDPALSPHYERAYWTPPLKTDFKCDISLWKFRANPKISKLLKTFFTYEHAVAGIQKAISSPPALNCWIHFKNFSQKYHVF